MKRPSYALRSFIGVLVAGSLTLALGHTTTFGQSDEADRVAESALVLSEIMDAADAGVPKSVLDKAEAIAVFPSTIKGAFIVGGSRGRGVISGRVPKTDRWSAPAFLTLTGGSLGLQIGGQATDLVLIVMNSRGLDKLAQNNFKIGGDASVAAGPVGREATASTDATFRAEILSYSRARGLFAGISLTGSTIRRDRDANEVLYGVAYNTRQIIVEQKGGSPEAVKVWLDALNRYLPPRKSS